MVRWRSGNRVERIRYYRYVRFRFYVPVKSRSRIGYVVKRVYRLVRYMTRKLRQLTSKERTKHWAARGLKIIIKYRDNTLLTPRNHPIASKLLTYQQNVTLRTDEEQKYKYLNYWHELDKHGIKTRVVAACKLIPRNVFARLRYIGIKAYNFQPLHIPKWYTDVDPKEFDETIETMRKHGRVSEDMVYKPLDEFHKVLQSADYYHTNKISIISSSPKTKKPANTRSVNNRGSMLVMDKRNSGPPAHPSKKLRQTKIEEFFKPRSRLTNGNGGSMAKQNHLLREE